MACRNLTKKFVDIRNAAKANRHLNVKGGDSDDSKGSESILLQSEMSNSSNWKSPKNTLPPAWVDQIEAAEEDVSKIQSKIQELNALHNKRLMVNFEADETQQEREIDSKTREITGLFHHAEGVLKRFGKQSEDPSLTVAERTVRRNMQVSMAKKIQGLSMSFRSTQKQYLMKLQGQKQGSGAQAFEFLNEPSKKPAALQADDDVGFDNMQMQILEDTEDLVNQRDEEITRIAKSIEELAQIFKELAVLVIDQGTVLDRIDYNMEHAVEHAREGVKQLSKAEEHQKANLAIKCIIVLVILNGIMIAVLAWKHSEGNKK
mmetsp:Transcript_3698/g.6130  ORF Transcript_3698/g.6130 Transcript_3698/m.6130 type:complete len:318 (+) Transcript_3698:107-1060(+)